MGNWQSMETAPRNGVPILGIYNNDLSWEYRLVYWSNEDRNYPWQSVYGEDDCAWPEGRVDYWMPLQEPPYTETDY